MGFDPELTKQILGDVGPLRFNPKVVKVCQTCNTNHIVRYKGANKPTTPFFCRKCVVNRPEVKKKLSDHTTKQWENPEFARLVQNNSRAIWNDQERRAKMGKIHNDPQIIAATVKRNKTREYDSDQIAATMRQLWLDPQYRENLITHIHRSKKSTEEIINTLSTINGDRFDYTDTKYTDSHTKIKIRCKTCQNDQYSFIHNHIRNATCCHCQVSSGQRSIIDFIKEYDTNIVINDRLTLNPLELDIYLPQRQLAIEYHGLYFHSYSSYPTAAQKTKHQHKALVCRDRNIKLIQLFSNEWNEQAKAKLRYHLGVVNRRIGARQCSITTEIPADFFDLNHFQGGRPARLAFGLQYDGEVVAAMSFSHHAKYQWEIIRYACKCDVVVSGGARRLFNAFLTAQNPNSVISYSDLRYSVGNIYQILGFEYLGHTKPNYFYTDRFSIFSRQSYQKHKLPKKLVVFDPVKSEIENCLANDLRIGYDAGHTKWLWKPPIKLTQKN